MFKKVFSTRLGLIVIVLGLLFGIGLIFAAIPPAPSAPTTGPPPAPSAPSTPPPPPPPSIVEPPPPSPLSPAAPLSLRASTVSNSEIRLIWIDASDNEDGFYVERSSVSGTSGFSRIDTIGIDVDSYNDTGLSSGTTYWYRVQAFNDVGVSEYSSVDSATTSGGNGNGNGNGNGRQRRQ